MVQFAAIMTSLCAPLVLSAPPTAAAATKLTVATGSITCRKLTGGITITPPVRNGVDQVVEIVLSFHASACTTRSSNVALVNRGNMTLRARGPVHGCSVAEGQLLLSGTERWQPGTIAPSTVIAEGITRRANGGASGLVFSSTPGRQQVIVAPAAGKTMSVRGSFAGKASYVSQENLDGSILAYTDLVTGQLDAECKSPAGISVLNVVSGVETLP